ncbi:hypothetical protein HZA87_02865 [Candidatus Uhrbacteria bacterium]|nr:hypothetical protein [Candidatus Uhrbacteria bacterium]
MPKKKRRVCWWVKKATFLLMERNEKDLLVRSENSFIIRVAAGDLVSICCQIDGKERRLVRRIVARRNYPTMLGLLDHEVLSRLAHGNLVQTMSYLARIYTREQEESPAVVYEVKPPEEPLPHD